MPDRVVYLVDKAPAGADAADLTFVTDLGLGNLLQEGWEISTTIPRRKVQVGKRTVEATMMVLKRAEENRGVTAPGRGGSRGRGDDREVSVPVDDGFGGHRQTSLPAAMAQMLGRLGDAIGNMGGASHLGPPARVSIPGLSIVSGSAVSQAEDMGVTAAKTGQPASACPWPSGTPGAQKWLQGYRMVQAGAGASASELDAAYAAGARLARTLADEDVVSCPYPPGSPTREAWMKGFRANGGVVE